MRSGLIIASASSPSRCCVEIEHALDLDRASAGRRRRPRSGPTPAPCRRAAGTAARPPCAPRRAACAMLVREHDRQRHQLARLVRRVAEHHPLVAGADAVERVVVARVVLHLVRRVDALRDVGRLLVERDDDAARLGVEAVLGARVADARRPSRARGAGCRRTSSVVISPATTTRPVVISVSQATRLDRVVREDRVEDGVRDLVGDLVGVPLGDRLRGEEEGALRHIDGAHLSRMA